MKKKIIVLFGIVALATVMTGCTASTQRATKSLVSDWTGGLNRTVTVYDYNGGELGSWSGKFDVSENDNETYFDVNGKRVIIQGGIIINEEQ